MHDETRWPTRRRDAEAMMHAPQWAGWCRTHTDEEGSRDHERKLFDTDEQASRHAAAAAMRYRNMGYEDADPCWEPCATESRFSSRHPLGRKSAHRRPPVPADTRRGRRARPRCARPRRAPPVPCGRNSAEGAATVKGTPASSRKCPQSPP